MISASRAGGSPTSARRALISGLKSGMLNPCDAADRLDELDPTVALLRQHLFARWRKAIITATTLPGFFNRATAGPGPVFQPLEVLGELPDVDQAGATRAQFDKLS